MKVVFLVTVCLVVLSIVAGLATMSLSYSKNPMGNDGPHSISPMGNDGPHSISPMGNDGPHSIFQ